MLVRKDLTPQQQAVQAAHATLEAGRHISPSREHPHLVLLGVRSEAQLENALRKLKAQGIDCHEFREADLDDQLTAFCTEPISGDARRHFKRFNLLTPVCVSCNRTKEVAYA